MNVSDFLDKINEKTWRNNIREDASRNLDKILEYIQENRDLILEEVFENVQRIEEVKKEDDESFGYSDAEKWSTKYVKEAIKGLL